VLDYKFFNNNIHRHINSSTHKLLNLKSPSCLQLAKLELIIIRGSMVVVFGVYSRYLLKIS